MKLSHKSYKINTSELLTVAFDVSKDTLNCYSEFNNKTSILEDSFVNRSSTIQTKLQELLVFAKSHGLSGLHITCEPTGGYEKKLLKTARRLGHTTSLVSGEAVHKAKVIESNDTGKTDSKDPRVIHMLATMGKTLINRTLSGEYALLRELNRHYDTEDRHRTRLRGQIHRLLVQLYCDYSFKKDFLYGNTGRGLMQTYAFNPYKIMADGFETLSKNLKATVRGVRTKTLQRLWNDAESSTLHQLEPAIIRLLQQRLLDLWEEFLLREKRLEALREQMILLYESLKSKQEPVPEARKGLMNKFIIARILGEFGRLNDFPNAKALLRYAGMNLRERKSGQYVGKVRMSKKGRSRARYILSQAVLPLVRKKDLYGAYYHHKKQQGMCGTKAMCAVARKFLKLFFALSKPNTVFNKERVFACESQHRIAA